MARRGAGGLQKDYGVPVCGCAAVQDVLFSGQQRQAERVQVDRLHPEAVRLLFFLFVNFNKA